MTATALPTLDTPFTIADREFRSRLLVGTGKYASNEQMVNAIDASGADVVTVAVRRIDLDRTKDVSILHHLDPSRFFLLANTAGCYTADDAMRYARLARAAGFNEWVKLEVIGDQATLLPDAAATILATLLARLDLDPRLVVVEHNRVILRDRDAYGAIALADDDVLELVHFVGGG